MSHVQVRLRRPAWSNCGEITSNSYKDIVFTRFFRSLPAVTMTFDLLIPKTNQHTCEPIYKCDQNWLKFPSLVFTRTWLRYVRVFAVAIPSVVCNVGAPYSGGWTFGQYFFTAVYLVYLWLPCKISRRSSPQSEALNARGVAKYSDFGHIEGYISQTVQDRRIASIKDE